MIALSLYCLATDWTTGVRSSAETKDFSSSLFVQTSSEAHPAFYAVGIVGVLSQGNSAAGAWRWPLIPI
jgi:hypothetical protein